MISEKSFLSSCIHHMIDTYIPNFTFLASVALTLNWYVPSTTIPPLQGMISEKSFFSIKYIVIGSYIPNFMFLASIVLALHWYVSFFFHILYCAHIFAVQNLKNPVLLYSHKSDGARPHLVRGSQRNRSQILKKSTLWNLLPWGQFPGYVSRPVLGYLYFYYYYYYYYLFIYLFISYKPLRTSLFQLLLPFLPSFSPFTPYLILSLYISLLSSVQVQTGPAVHSASYKMSTEFSPGV